VVDLWVNPEIHISGEPSGSHPIWNILI
jgi:hypothetical protein